MYIGLKKNHQMKFLLLLLTNISIGQSILFENTIDDAFQKAKQNNKIVFIYYYNEDCSVCKKTQKLFDEADLYAYYNANFVSYKINTRKELNVKEKGFIEKTGLKFESVPFLLFFDANGNYLHHSGARSSVAEIKEIGRIARNPDLRNASLKGKYAKGDRSIKTLYAYADYLRLKNDYVTLNKVTADLYEAFPKNDLASSKSYIILKNVIVDIENGFFKFWINNLDKISGLDSGMRNGNEKTVLEEILLRHLTGQEHLKWSETKKNEVKEMIKKLGITDKPEVFFEN
jgi:hypothetical protein